MSAETYTYKGISAGKYIEGTIEAMSQDEASFKLKEQKIIITNLTRTKKKAAEKKKSSGGGISLFKKKVKLKENLCFSGNSGIVRCLLDTPGQLGFRITKDTSASDTRALHSGFRLDVFAHFCFRLDSIA